MSTRHSSSSFTEETGAVGNACFLSERCECSSSCKLKGRAQISEKAWKLLAAPNESLASMQKRGTCGTHGSHYQQHVRSASDAQSDCSHVTCAEGKALHSRGGATNYGPRRPACVQLSRQTSVGSTGLAAAHAHERASASASAIAVGAQLSI
mmetsp:Transcript_44862/g.93510  ORF Transcript_44862/g.93510 Transcript_44862/m.93510 type:complete len:152 (-) Transcript_44862:1587-2042(-)